MNTVIYLVNLAHCIKSYMELPFALKTMQFYNGFTMKINRNSERSPKNKLFKTEIKILWLIIGISIEIYKQLSKLCKLCKL